MLHHATVIPARVGVGALHCTILWLRDAELRKYREADDKSNYARNAAAADHVSKLQ